jgi:hypothetical protein
MQVLMGYITSGMVSLSRFIVLESLSFFYSISHGQCFDVRAPEIHLAADQNALQHSAVAPVPDRPRCDLKVVRNFCRGHQRRAARLPSSSPSFSLRVIVFGAGSPVAVPSGVMAQQAYELHQSGRLGG